MLIFLISMCRLSGCFSFHFLLLIALSSEVLKKVALYCVLRFFHTYSANFTLNIGKYAVTELIDKVKSVYIIFIVSIRKYDILRQHVILSLNLLI